MMKNNWILCSERLPKTSGEVIICDKFGDVTIAGFDIKCKQFIDVFSRCVLPNIIAWIPLPEPYEKK